MLRLRSLLGRVEDGRFARTLAGFQAGWQWRPDTRVFRDAGDFREVLALRGVVAYGDKRYEVAISRYGRGYQCRCGCSDYVRRGMLCKHIAFAVMADLAFYAAERSAHREVPELG